MVVVYVISVIMMDCTVSYKAICYVVNSSWHTVCSAV